MTGEPIARVRWVVTDVDEAATRIEALGGRRVGGVRELDGYRWQVMTDPEGNEFCVTPG